MAKAVPLSEAVHDALEALDHFNRAQRIPDLEDRERLSTLLDDIEAAIRAQLMNERRK